MNDKDNNIICRFDAFKAASRAVGSKRSNSGCRSGTGAAHKRNARMATPTRSSGTSARGRRRHPGHTGAQHEIRSKTSKYLEPQLREQVQDQQAHFEHQTSKYLEHDGKSKTRTKLKMFMEKQPQAPQASPWPTSQHRTKKPSHCQSRQDSLLSCNGQEPEPTTPWNGSAGLGRYSSVTP